MFGVGCLVMIVENQTSPTPISINWRSFLVTRYDVGKWNHLCLWPLCTLEEPYHTYNNNREEDRRKTRTKSKLKVKEYDQKITWSARPIFGPSSSICLITNKLQICHVSWRRSQTWWMWNFNMEKFKPEYIFIQQLCRILNCIIW